LGALSIRDVRKTFGATEVLKGINLEIEAGEFLILVGPSGCGKSTLLNMIAGLDSVSAGEICISGRRVNELSPKDRDIAMVFQTYALYPNMTVRQNIAFGLQMRKVPRTEQEQIVARVAQILQIESLLKRKPAQLSGGQRQRVAMGRAIARNPTLFLFDEPLSNLDAKLRVEMRTEIKQLHHKLRTTTVYVTHDQIEAMTLGDKIAVMRSGEVMQFGTPQEIYDNPANVFVAGFMGSPSMNFITARVREHNGDAALVLNVGDAERLLPIVTGAPGLRNWVGREVVLGLRPEQISHKVDVLARAPHMACVSAQVELAEPTGADTLIVVRVNGKPVVCRVQPQFAQGHGATMELMVDLSKAVFFDPHSEQRIR
jgi:multiple sugar transport system ATP-binding protein